MFKIDENIWFWTLLLIPLVLVVFALELLWRKSVQKHIGNTALLERLSPNQSLFKRILKLLVFVFSIAALTMALVNPKLGTKLETVRTEGVDIVFEIDVSKSMLAEDIAPNRLEKSKQLVTQIINSLAGDRVGIIAYAGKAIPQLPITTDYASAKMFLQNMNTNMLSSQGTAIHEAIELSKTFFDKGLKTNKILIIISDGEDHEGQAIKDAEAALDEGIKIITIGVGNSKGAPIPIREKGQTSYKKDQNGATVITKLNEIILKEIAKVSKGTYIDGKNTKLVVQTINEQLDKMDKQEFESKQIAGFKDQFQWFLGIALFLLFIDIFLLERKTEWLKKLNLFNENF